MRLGSYTLRELRRQRARTLLTVAGVVLAFPFAPAQWSTARTVAAGLFAGLGTGLTIVATRMLGAFGE